MKSEGVARIAMHQPMTVDLMGKRPLQVGDLCICGCSPPPTLISSQGFAGFGNGQIFQYHPAPVASGNTEKLAVLDEAGEAECFADYERDMDMCQIKWIFHTDPRTYALCKEQAFMRYQQCRGY
jgi:hypothetical protein